MIKVIYGDIRPLLSTEAFSLFLEKLEGSVRERILEPKRKEHRAHRLAYYLMLDALYRRDYGAPLPQLLFADLGKPYLEKGPALSVSHDQNFVAVAMTGDFEQLGIDIQQQPNPVTASRVRRRFLTPIPPYRKASPEIEFMMAHAEADGMDLTPTHAFGTPSTFLCDYVRAEAIMKMTGGGFSDFPRLAELCATCETAILPLGDVAIGLAYR